MFDTSQSSHLPKQTPQLPHVKAPSVAATPLSEEGSGGVMGSLGAAWSAASNGVRSAGSAALNSMRSVAGEASSWLSGGAAAVAGTTAKGGGHPSGAASHEPHVPKDEKSKYDYYRHAIEASGGKFDLKPGQRNVMGLRGMQDGELNKNQKDRYNDSLVVVWADEKGQKHVHEYKGSVDPGSYAGGNPKGDANLMDGQYNYQRGIHHGASTGAHEALVQNGNVRVWRDKDKDGHRDKGEIDEQGYFGINIHAGGSGKNVGHNSEGCQVISGGYNGEQWKDFMKQMKADPDGKFKYTLIDGTRLAGLEDQGQDKKPEAAAKEGTKGIDPGGLAKILQGPDALSLPTLNETWQGVKGAWEGAKKWVGGMLDPLLGGKEKGGGAHGDAQDKKTPNLAPESSPPKHDEGEHDHPQHLSKQQLQDIVPTMKGKRADQLVGPLNQALELAGCNTPQRRAMFMAQLAHETGGFQWLHELGGHHYFDKYEPNTKKGRELGNKEPGDGERFKGRGFIHITGRGNYEKAGKAIGVDLIKHPELAEDPNVAAKVAAWYWQNHTIKRGKGKAAKSYHLNELADRGDFEGVTRGVNGGLTGLASRKAYYKRASAEFAKDTDEHDASDHSMIRQLFSGHGAEAGVESGKDYREEIGGVTDDAQQAASQEVLTSDNDPLMLRRAWEGAKHVAGTVVDRVSSTLSHWTDVVLGQGQKPAAEEEAAPEAPVHSDGNQGLAPTSDPQAAKSPGAHGPELGTLSAKYESRGGAGTVSTGKGDAGGASYGLYQMTSKSKGKVGGTVEKFVSDSKWASQFNGLTPGSKAFTAQWKAIAAKDPDAFREAQHEFIKETHYDVQAEKLKEDIGLDVNQRSNALQQVLWSTSVQHGGETSVVEQALKGKDASKLSDEEIMHLIYQERGRKDKNGTLVHFSRNSADVQKGVSKRFVSEEKEARLMLKQEQSGDGAEMNP